MHNWTGFVFCTYLLRFVFIPVLDLLEKYAILSTRVI